ncbi:MAG: DUF6064 family protein [Pseudomonadota bacterium]
MKLPFIAEQFLQIFKTYNLEVWPIQIVLNILALLAILAAIYKQKHFDKLISLILSFFWLWIGIVYHLHYFTTINKAAYGFGILFIIQGGLFFITGVLNTKLSFRYQTDMYGITGSLFLIYALIIYPILGHVLGHQYPQSPTFGLPCPTTIFTFGLLLWTNKAVPKYLLIIPLVWSVVGFGAALSLDIREDFGLLIAGVAGCLLIVIRDKQQSLTH